MNSFLKEKWNEIKDFFFYFIKNTPTENEISCKLITTVNLLFKSLYQKWFLRARKDQIKARSIIISNF